MRSQRAGTGMAAGRENRRKQDRVDAAAVRPDRGRAAVCGGGETSARRQSRPAAGEAVFGEMQAGGPDPAHQGGVAGNQEDKSASPADGGESGRESRPVRGRVIAADDTTAPRQSRRHRQRVVAMTALGDIDEGRQTLDPGRNVDHGNGLRSTTGGKN